MIHRLAIGVPTKLHAQIQFLVDDLQRLGYALFAYGAQAVEEGAAYKCLVSQAVT